MTGHPALPTVRSRKADPEEAAQAEERRRLAALDNDVRKKIADRSSDPARASRYDLLADALMGVVADQVFHAINSPDFAQALADRGYAVAVLPDGDPPAPPDDWSQEAADLMQVDGFHPDPFLGIEDLWRRAWTAGYAAGNAQTHHEESHL